MEGVHGSGFTSAIQQAVQGSDPSFRRAVRVREAVKSHAWFILPDACGEVVDYGLTRLQVENLNLYRDLFIVGFACIVKPFIDQTF